MEKFEYKGIWWLPGKTEHQVPGIVSFHPVDGAVLKTIGNDFPDRVPFLFLADQNALIDVICGYTEKGESITLYKCRPYGETTARGYTESVYKIYAVFIGCHFDSEADLYFDSIAINYSGMEEWVGISGFRHDWNLSESNTYYGSVTHAPSEEISFRVNDFTLTIYYAASLFADGRFDIEMKQRTFLRIVPDNPMAFDTFQSKILYNLRNFLSLGMGATVVPLIVTGKRKECAIEQPTGENILKNIDIFYVAKGSAISEAKRNLDNMLFGYADIAANLEIILQKWFTKAEQVRPIFDLYFGLFYLPSIYVHLQFLTLAQALETYHRSLYGGVYLPEEEYKPIWDKLIDAIKNDVDNDHLRSLAKGTQYGFEYSFRKRLKLIFQDILKDYKEILDRIIPNQRQFIDQLVDTRNYLTHYSKNLGDKAITDPGEQYGFVRKMKLIMQLCFLVEIGLPAEIINGLARRNKNFIR